MALSRESTAPSADGGDTGAGGLTLGPVALYLRANQTILARAWSRFPAATFGSKAARAISSRGA